MEAGLAVPFADAAGAECAGSSGKCTCADHAPDHGQITEPSVIEALRSRQVNCWSRAGCNAKPPREHMHICRRLAAKNDSA